MSRSAKAAIGLLFAVAVMGASTSSAFGLGILITTPTTTATMTSFTLADNVFGNI